MFGFAKKSPKFWFFNILTAIACYGFELTNSSIGVDDENVLRALGGRMIEQGRLGYNIVDMIFDISSYMPFIYLFFCLGLFIIANAIITDFFEKLSDKFSETESIIYSVVVLSYPAFAYKLIFNMCQLQMGLVYFFAVLCVIHCYKIYKDNKLFSVTTLFAMAEIFFIIANFETGIIYVAILFVYAIILSNEDISFWKLFKKAVYVLIVVLAAFIVNKILVEIVRNYLGIVPDDYTSGYIKYNSENLFGSFVDTIVAFWTQQMTAGLSSLFLIVILVGFALFIRKQSLSTINKVLLYLAEIILFMSFPMITGDAAPLERAVLYKSFFWAICACSTAMVVKDKKVFKCIFWIIFTMSTYANVMEVNQVIYQDYVKNDLDKNLAYEIYEDIQELDYLNKPVVFVGAIQNYDLPFEVRLGTSSMFNHDIAHNNNLAYETPNFRVYAYFDMLGLDIIEADDSLTIESTQACVGVPCYPAEGSVFETSDAIVVKLGEYNLFNGIDVTNIQNSSDFISCEDYYYEDEDYIEIAGWVFSEQYKPARVTKYLLFTNVETGESFYTICADTERRDVVDAYGVKDEYKWSGYRIKLQKQYIPEGRYNIQVVTCYKGTFYDFDSNVYSINIE